MFRASLRADDAACESPYPTYLKLVLLPTGYPSWGIECRRIPRYISPNVVQGTQIRSRGKRILLSVCLVLIGALATAARRAAGYQSDPLRYGRAGQCSRTGYLRPDRRRSLSGEPAPAPPQEVSCGVTRFSASSEADFIVPKPFSLLRVHAVFRSMPKIAPFNPATCHTTNNFNILITNGSPPSQPFPILC